MACGMHGKEVPERGQSMSPFPAENDEISDISKSVYHFMPFSSHDSEVKCGQAVPKRSHRGLGERFWTTDTEIYRNTVSKVLMDNASVLPPETRESLVHLVDCI